MRFLCCGLMSAPPERPCDRRVECVFVRDVELCGGFPGSTKGRDRMSWRCARLGFFGRRLVGLMLDGSHHGKGEHDERDVTMPAVPGFGFVVVEPELVFGVSKLSSIAQRWPSTRTRVL